MNDHPESRRYYPEEENVPLSEAVLEAVRAHEDPSVSVDEFGLYDRIHPDAIDALFRDTSDTDVHVRIDLRDVTVNLWSDGGVDIRVTGNGE